LGLAQNPSNNQPVIASLSKYIDWWAIQFVTMMLAARQWTKFPAGGSARIPENKFLGGGVTVMLWFTPLLTKQTVAAGPPRKRTKKSGWEVKRSSCLEPVTGALAVI
jgi:hypothetical protein